MESSIQQGTSPQSQSMRDASSSRFVNGEIHSWYRIALGFSDQLVSDMLQTLNVTPGQVVLDPFCGTGTTLVECMKRGIDSVGIDANPSSHFASRVKTNWSLSADMVTQLLAQVESSSSVNEQGGDEFMVDPTYRYLEWSGMLARSWISPQPLKKAIGIKRCIQRLDTSEEYKAALMLALIAEVVENASNVKFGPELYCATAKKDVDVLTGFAVRVQLVAKDLASVSTSQTCRPKVIMGDSRECGDLLLSNGITSIDAVITSPPYPGEHDYTRNARLELAFLEEVSDRSTLQAIKRTMVRSHTKGIYKGDADGLLVQGSPEIDAIVARLTELVRSKTHGFAKLYPTVVREYFGGMMRHLASLAKVLRPGALCAYVVGDQSSYLQVHIPTAQILSAIACDLGYESLETIYWRSSWSTRTSKRIKENILILRAKG
ncbi:MAG: DNA methyltransferase [Anaerolineae bacterium]